jgi:glycosyltransferase involved in cell wall biosynthesis
MKDLRIEVVPNGVDTNCFKPFDMVTARNLLGIKENKKILLFSSINGLQHEHKGFHLLKSALAECSLVDGFKETVELYVAGSYEPENFSELTIQTHFLGQLNDDVTLALLYNAADLYLAPALLENFSTTVLEALACGTPSVAFNAGGMADLVDHGINGYLAQAYDVEDFARGIIWSLNDLEQLSVLSANGRRKAEEQFTLDLMAKRHIKLYEDVLG